MWARVPDFSQVVHTYYVLRTPYPEEEVWVRREPH